VADAWTPQHRTALSHDEPTRRFEAAVGTNSSDEMPSAGGDGNW